MNRARSEQRKTTTSAMSSGAPTRPSRRRALEALLLVREELKPRLGHRGQDHPRRDRVDPDVGPVLERGRRGQSDHPGLCCGVGRLPRCRPGPADRRGGHDAASAGRPDVGDRGPEPEVHAGQVDRDQTVPLLGIPPVQRGLVADPCVVEEEGDPLHGLSRGVDRGGQPRRIGHVGNVGAATDLLRHLGRRVAVEVDHRDRRTFLGHPSGGGTADARATSGDDRSLAVQQTHGRSLPRGLVTRAIRASPGSRRDDRRRRRPTGGTSTRWSIRRR